MAGAANSAFSQAASTFSPPVASRQASGEPGASACAVNCAARISRFRRSTLRSRTTPPAKNAHATIAPKPAPRPTTASRAMILDRVQSSARAQTSTSRAAAPDATQKRKCPTSGSMPSIARPMRGDDVVPPAQASMTQCCRARQSSVRRLVLHLKLALFSHALKGLAWILDAILIVLAIGRQQPHHLVAASRTRSGNRA